MSENNEQYSDSKLEEFKTIINEKIEETKKALATASGFQKDQKDTIASTNMDFNEGSKHFQQQATNKRMINRFTKKLNDLNAAMLRVEDKTYGVCTKSGQLIEEERLKAMPTARWKVSVKENIKK